MSFFANFPIIFFLYVVIYRKYKINKSLLLSGNRFLCVLYLEKGGMPFFSWVIRHKKISFLHRGLLRKKKMSKIYPTVVVPHAGNSTPHKIYRFENGYGASVVEHNDSYGVELALIKFVENGEWELVYNEDFPDVMGWCNEETIQEHLQKIKNY